MSLNTIRSTLDLREDINHFEIVDQNEGETGGESSQNISILNHPASKSRSVDRTGDRGLFECSREVGVSAHLPIGVGAGAAAERTDCPEME